MVPRCCLRIWSILAHAEQEPAQSGTVQKMQWSAIGVKLLGYCCFCIRRNKAEKMSSADYREVRPAVLSRVQACPEERRLPGCLGQWSCTPSPEHRTYMLRNRASQEGPLKREDRGMCLTHQLPTPLSPGPGSVGRSAPRSETEETSPNLRVLSPRGAAQDK